VAISLQKGEIAELVPNEVRNLAPGLLRHRLATSLAMTVSISISRINVTTCNVNWDNVTFCHCPDFGVSSVERLTGESRKPWIPA